MLPDNVLSTTAILAPYLPPDELDPEMLVDYELGGIGLNDASQGLKVQVWTARLEINYVTGLGSVYISAANHAESLLFSRMGMTELSLAFDQNMKPFIAFMEYGQSWFWWFDASLGDTVFTQLPSGSEGPKCCMDDKRKMQDATSDIILGYVRSGTLYYREQRDRFLVEYTLKTGITQQLIRVGMNRGNRLQFSIGLIEESPTVIVARTTVPGDRRVTVDGQIRRIVGAYHG